MLTQAIGSQHEQFVKESESLGQHVNNNTHQQNEEAKQNNNKLQEEFTTKNSSLQQDMNSVTQQQNGKIKKNTKNLREELGKRMDQKFDKQEKHMEKTLEMFTTTIMGKYAQTQSRTPPEIEPPPSEQRGVDSTTSEFYLLSDNESTSGYNTTRLLPHMPDVPMENNLPPDPNKTQQE